MPDVTPLGTNFDLGFQSDTSRDELNVRAAFRMWDYIPQLEAPLRKRGGWTYGSPDLSTIGLGSGVASIGWLPFAGDGQLAVVGVGGKVIQLKRFDGTGGTLLTDTGDTSIVPTWPVFWHKAGSFAGGLILGGLNQTGKVPKKYLGSTVAPLGGTPPQARMGFSWGEYLVLGNFYDSGGLKNYRLAFSEPGDPEAAWTHEDPTNGSRLDFPEEIVAGVPVQNAILVFGYTDCHLVTGDIPPPSGNLARKIMFAGQGTFDGRSVVGWRQFAIWANNTGVWMSDGATLTDLAADGGISMYYRQQVKGLSFVTGGSAVAQIYRDHYILVLKSVTGAVTTLVCDIARRVWTIWTNVKASCFAHRASAPGTATSSSDEELFFGSATTARIGLVSTLYSPSTNPALARDADGQPVQPVLETPYYRQGKLSSKRVRFVYAGYDLRSTANARLAMAYTLSPEPGAPYVSMVSLPATSTYLRKRVRFARHGLGFGLRLQQMGPSEETRLYSLEAEGHPLELMR